MYQIHNLRSQKRGRQWCTYQKTQRTACRRPGASPRIFEWGGGWEAKSNRRQGSQPTPKYLKKRKTPDFDHFILESGRSNGPVF